MKKIFIFLILFFLLTGCSKNALREFGNFLGDVSTALNKGKSSSSSSSKSTYENKNNGIKNSIGQISSALVNASPPEIKKKIAYFAVKEFKDKLLQKFRDYKIVNSQKVPTYFRITGEPTLEYHTRTERATISGIFSGDGYQNRKFRGRVDFNFAFSVTTEIDFLTNWESKSVLVFLNPVFHDFRMNHNYTGSKTIDNLITDGLNIEEKTLNLLNSEKGGPQKWVVEKKNDQWPAYRADHINPSDFIQNN